MSVSVVLGCGGRRDSALCCSPAGRPDSRLLDSQPRGALGVRRQLGPGVGMWRCRVLSQASMPRTSVLGLLVAVPIWGWCSLHPSACDCSHSAFPLPPAWAWGVCGLRFACGGSCVRLAVLSSGIWRSESHSRTASCPAFPSIWLCCPLGCGPAEARPPGSFPGGWGAGG